MALTAGCAQLSDEPHSWQLVDRGLQLARFKVAHSTPAGDSTIVVLRIDPAEWDVRLYSISEMNSDNRLTAKQWCDELDLTAAINAGMYLNDLKTHCGYMKQGDHFNNPIEVTRDYRSAAAFLPLADSLPPFRIYDLDEDSLHAIASLYDHVAQNIRLIKHSGENRWPERPKRWSEAALGQDSAGNVLFIFCRSPYTMYDFNELLLSLPLGLVAAQHLEGGPEAQMYFRHGDFGVSVNGSYETGFNETDFSLGGWPIPNVIGVKRKTASR
jgi:hypothetical protein